MNILGFKINKRSIMQSLAGIGMEAGYVLIIIGIVWFVAWLAYFIL